MAPTYSQRVERLSTALKRAAEAAGRAEPNQTEADLMRKVFSGAAGDALYSETQALDAERRRRAAERSAEPTARPKPRGGKATRLLMQFAELAESRYPGLSRAEAVRRAATEHPELVRLAVRERTDWGDDAAMLRGIVDNGR